MSTNPNPEKESLIEKTRDFLSTIFQLIVWFTIFGIIPGFIIRWLAEEYTVARIIIHFIPALSGNIW